MADGVSVAEWRALSSTRVRGEGEEVSSVAEQWVQQGGVRRNP
jgi:hypothetical protein